MFKCAFKVNKCATIMKIKDHYGHEESKFIFQQLNVVIERPF
jgi:hypothetical protein